jgi:phospholipid/cholesterol/gamma-HCH transport system substrate-binding protein
MTNLREILEKINQGQGTVGKLVNEQEFYKNAKLTLQKVDKATESLEDQGPLSVIGIIANGLF